MKTLLAKLLEDLRDAAFVSDDRRGLEIIGRNRHDTEPGARARRMVNAFQYQELPAGLVPLPGGKSE